MERRRRKKARRHPPAAPPRDKADRLEQLRSALRRGDIPAARDLLDSAGPTDRPAARPGPPGAGTVHPPSAPFGPAGEAQPPPPPANWAVESRIKRGRSAWTCLYAEQRSDAEAGGPHGWGDLAQEAADTARAWLAAGRGVGERLDELGASPGLCHIANGGPDGPLFVRLTARRGDGLILLSTLAWSDGLLRARHWLARTPFEESALAAAFLNAAESAGTLVTFDGTKKDLPLLKTCCDAHDLEWLWQEPPHLDLRPEARRQWRGRVPRFTLAALRRWLGRGPRRGPRDPDAVLLRFRFFGDPAGLAALLRAHAADLLTMVQMVIALLTGREPDG